MSDVLDWIAISAWSTAVGIQTGTAVYDFWKGRRTITTEYEEVRNGKTVNGWRMVVPIPSRKWDIFCPLDQADNDESGLSALLFFSDRTFGGNRRVISFVRQSLILPSASDTICRIEYDPDEWPNKFYSRATARISAAVFQRRSESHYRLVLFDTISKHHRAFSIDTPAADGRQEIFPMMVHGYDAARGRIIVVFFTPSQAHGAHVGAYYNIYDRSYEFPTSSGDQAAVVKATSWESLSIPTGGRDWVFWSEVNAAAGFVYQNGFDDMDNDLAVSFDRKRNTWRVDTVRSWFDRLWSTADGAKYSGAMESFEALSPPE